MHSCICYHCSTRRLDGLHNFISRFLAWPLLVLAGKAVSPPIYFTPEFWCGWHIPIGILFLVSQGLLSKTLASRKNIEGSTLFLIFKLRLLCVWRFTEVSEVVRKLNECFRTSWFVCIIRYSLWYLLLSPGFWSSDCYCMVTVLWDYLP